MSVGALREDRVDEVGPSGERSPHQPPDALEQLRSLPSRGEEFLSDLVRSRAGEGRAIALGRPRRACRRERLQRRPHRGAGRQLGQASHDVPRREASLELGLRGQRLIGVPAQRGAPPGWKERLDQRTALGLVRVDGRPQRLGGIHPGREEPGLVGPRLEGELLESQRLRPDRATIRFAALEELRRTAKPGGLDVLRLTERIRSRAQPFPEALQGSEERPRGPR